MILWGACGTPAPAPPPAPPLPDPTPSNVWADLVLREEVLAVVQTELLDLQHDLPDLRLPSERTRSWFAPSVEVRDVLAVGPWARASDLPARFGVESAATRFGETAAHPHDTLDLLRPVFALFHTVDDAQISALRGDFVGPDRHAFAADIKLTLLGDGTDGSRVEVVLHGSIEADWAGAPELNERAVWRITQWSMDSARVRRRAAGAVFVDVLNERAGPALGAALIRSEHEELLEVALADPRGFPRPHNWWDPVSHDRHPGLAVGDVDGDGRDELYVMGRRGRNMLLAVTDGGALVDRAPELGLDLDGHCSSALFLDIDNDGDTDLLVGRTLERSVLLMQEDGRFVDRSSSGAPLPRMVSGLSAADIDGDGRIDVYAATYAKKVGARAAPELWPADESERATLLAREPYTDSAGPTNVLLRNLGGRFEDISRASGAGVARQTFMGTFADVDGDGDADLYLANDFAPNTLLRNLGDGTFEDATAQSSTPDQGFGMGATFGDIDGDADLDLYVSNMYSKAGERILAEFPDLDPRYAAMARGNSLLRNDGGVFRRISGRTAADAQVEASGWSWSGLLPDLDADGALDVAVLNGYFTPPRRYARPVDI